MAAREQAKSLPAEFKTSDLRLLMSDPTTSILADMEAAGYVEEATQIRNWTTYGAGFICPIEAVRKMYEIAVCLHDKSYKVVKVGLGTTNSGLCIFNTAEGAQHRGEIAAKLGAQAASINSAIVEALVSRRCALHTLTTQDETEDGASRGGQRAQLKIWMKAPSIAKVGTTSSGQNGNLLMRGDPRSNRTGLWAEIENMGDMIWTHDPDRFGSLDNTTAFIVQEAAAKAATAKTPKQGKYKSMLVGKDPSVSKPLRHSTLIQSLLSDFLTSTRISLVD